MKNTNPINKQAADDLQKALTQLCDLAGLRKGDVVVIGCSTSEVCGEQIGSASVPELGAELVQAALSVLKKRGLFLAAQCCEHLNRSLVIEEELVRQDLRYKDEIVNVVPQPKAGGSFAAAAYLAFKNPVVVAHVKADAGLDIGGTLIGMHLREVAVPVRLNQKHIGGAVLLAARTRARFVGGSRALYDEKLQ